MQRESGGKFYRQRILTAFQRVCYIRTIRRAVYNPAIYAVDDDFYRVFILSEIRKNFFEGQKIIEFEFVSYRTAIRPRKKNSRQYISTAVQKKLQANPLYNFF